MNKFHTVTNTSSGQIIATRVKIAEDFKSRSVGLLNRSSLDEDEGLLISPCNSIHTFFMKFPIDIVFLDKKGVVVRTIENMVPSRMACSMLKAFDTLELVAGKLKKTPVKVGDLLKIA